MRAMQKSYIINWKEKRRIFRRKKGEHEMYRDRNEVHEFSQWVNSMSQDFMTGALTFRDENKNPITNGYAVIMD